MSHFSDDYHRHQGMRHFQMEDWDRAANHLAAALWNGQSEPSPEMVATWAKAVLRSSIQWDAKVTALISGSGIGNRHPEYWALALKTYLSVLDEYDGRRKLQSEAHRRLIRRLRNAVADCVDTGMRHFRELVACGSREAYAWGAALVCMGDWIYAFQGMEAGIAGRYPYRPIAESLYRPVATAELEALFDDADIREDIRSHLIARSRRQLHAIAAANPVRSPKMRGSLIESPGCPFFGQRVLSP